VKNSDLNTQPITARQPARPETPRNRAERRALAAKQRPLHRARIGSAIRCNVRNDWAFPATSSASLKYGRRSTGSTRSSTSNERAFVCENF